MLAHKSPARKNRLTGTTEVFAGNLDMISKEFYYLGHMEASGKTKEFIMPNTTASAVEIEWMLDVPVRSDLYEYIIS